VIQGLTEVFKGFAENSAALTAAHVNAIAIMLLLGACNSPAENFNEAAASLELRRDVVRGIHFQHAVFWRVRGPSETLHVYLGGDGTAVSAGQPAADPTPRNPLMLRLLSLDPGPAVYLGRPCYHGLAATSHCSGDVWTSGRYSEGVVSSLAAAARRIFTEGEYSEIVLFGHSGGGTLALLLAERFPETKAIVTIAANLDIDAWADHHGSPRLTGSVNPATRPPLNNRVVQSHYAGGRDRIVPPSVVRNTLARWNIEALVIEDFDHVCCWENIWPDILVAHQYSLAARGE
jgi:hypothetical protein